jgi:hypothetical protein
MRVRYISTIGLNTNTRGLDALVPAITALLVFSHTPRAAPCTRKNGTMKDHWGWTGDNRQETIDRRGETGERQQEKRGVLRK